ISMDRNQPQLVLANTYKPILEEIQTFIGIGKIYSRKPRGGTKMFHRFAIAQFSDVLYICRNMLPYMREKRGSATKVIRFICEKYPIHNQKVTNLDGERVYPRISLQGQHGHAPFIEAPDIRRRRRSS